MPTPEVLAAGDNDPFSLYSAGEHTNEVAVAYATNRIGVGPMEQRAYLTLFDQDLRLGFAQLRLGPEALDWSELHRASRSAERRLSIPLELVNASESAELDLDSAAPLSPQARGFFTAINAALAESLDKDLTIYLHGANSSFYRASAHAAQYRHFTGRNSVVLAFAWPSAASLLRYAVDVNNARRSVAAFARLLELLAAHTDAKHIDILAYSAGAQVLSPALALLKDKYGGEQLPQIKKRLRLGEVYFAAPDTDFRQFIRELSAYIDLAEHVTLAINPNDAVLAMAANHHGVSRAGRPDAEELTLEETQWIREASRDLAVDLIWITSNEIPGLRRGAHNFWYSHPWVSTDVLMQLLFNARPAERGLAVFEEEGTVRVWYFPPDYPQRAADALEALKALHQVGQPRQLAQLAR